MSNPVIICLSSAVGPSRPPSSDPPGEARMILGIRKS